MAEFVRQAFSRRNLEKSARSGNFFEIRRIFFPDRVEFGLAAREHEGDN
jgi:hypothetical protein